MAMPEQSKIEAVINKRFKRTNGRPMDKTMLSWCVMAFKVGYDKGQDDFMETHDWYERS